MSTESDVYLAVLKASYDYEPQSEDEIAVKEDQILFLLERTDEDWWKVKVKGETQEEETPSGLVPAAYVEQADHTSTVKVLYDYEAAAPGELSVHEDQILLVFETEEDWILVQTQGEDGKAGFVPGNYVEAYGGEEEQAEEEEPAPAPQIIVPPSNPRPVSTYVDPADRVAATKVSSDGIQTWSVSEIDKKGKKKKGTLGIGNGSVFFASEADKTPVQKWQISDLLTVTSEKSKHVTLQFVGDTPVTLTFHAGSKDTAEAILTKAKSSKALAESASQEHLSSSPPAEPIARSIGNRKPSVHFNEAPTIIPDEDSGPEEELEESPRHSVDHSRSVPTPSALSGEQTGIALYDFTAVGEDELSVADGESLVILEKDSEEWWKCRNSAGHEGVVPASYIEVSNVSSSQSAPSLAANKAREEAAAQSAANAAAAAAAAEEERKRKAEERKAREREERERKERAARKEAERKAREQAEEEEEEEKRREEKERAARAAAKKKEKERNKEAPKLPPEGSTRIWHDRSGQFRVEAAFLGFKDGKLRLHKINGVVVEVPTDKMSVEDLKYLESLTGGGKKSRPSTEKQYSEDDIPLGLTKPGRTAEAKRAQPPAKKGPQIDWFDFFLSAGCDVDDCTRYAAAFERDKIDESILPDITDGNMRTLGVREGDIIRITKAIEKRKPTDNLHKPRVHDKDQIERDAALARELQAQEQSRGSRSPAPNLFASGPGGALKQPQRRGRPQPTKSATATAVDINAISSASDKIQRTTSPAVSTPTNTSSSPAPAPATGNLIQGSGFDDDAWTNRPSSTKPVVGTPTPRTPSAPPVTTSPAPVAAAAAQVAPTPPPAPPAPAPIAQTASAPQPTNLAKTTETDIFDQLARLSKLRENTSPPAAARPGSVPLAPPAASPLNMASSAHSTPPVPLQPPTISPPPQQPMQYNGPRGPFAPIPANQGLLQPLIPTQTGFNSFIPTRGTNSVSPFGGGSQMGAPSFLSTQPTGIPPLPTGSPFGNMGGGGSFNPMQNGGGFNSMQNGGGLAPMTTGFNPMQNGSGFQVPMQTGFNPMQNGGFNANASPFGDPSSPLSASSFASQPFNNQPTGFNPAASVPPKDTTPANIFAQMKSGTFAQDNPPMGQTTGWNSGYTTGGF